MIIKQEKQKKKNLGGINFGIKVRNVIIVFLLLAICLIIFVTNIYIKIQYHPTTNVPNHPAGVPLSAVWFGGPDGGTFFDLVEIKNDSIYRFKIYSDYSGDLMMDADFKLRPIEITKENWHKEIWPFYMPGDSGSTLIQSERTTVMFEAIYPAYGGDQWEIINDKYDLGY